MLPLTFGKLYIEEVHFCLDAALFGVSLRKGITAFYDSP